MAHTIPLIPPEALTEWRNLSAALLVHGPAPCERSGTPDDWYAVDGSAEQERARTGCGVCGAAPECLAYAVAANEREGLWGGQTVAERRKTTVAA